MMKKLLLSLAFAGALAINAKSQGLYFNLGAGYGFKAGSQTVGVNKNSDGSTQSVNGSYGAGFVPTLGAGYLFNKNVGAELNLGYLFGKTINVNQSIGTLNMRAHSFFINPSLVVRANGDSKIVPYGKLGIFLGLANNIKVTQNTTTNTVSGNVATGITSALGIDYKLSDNLAIFGELTSRLATWNAKKYSATTNVGNSTITIDGNYVKTLPAANSGNDVRATLAPFSAFGFNIGIRYCLFK